MKKEEKVKYLIDKDILNNYIDAITFIKSPMTEIKNQLFNLNDYSDIRFRCINDLINVIKEFIDNNSNDLANIYFDIITQLIDSNNGMLSTRMIEPLNINRQYLSIMEKNGLIEKVTRGVYIKNDSFEDSYFSFQQKYKKAIYSHMNALYFYGLTEEFPYSYTVSVPSSYHDSRVNDKCNVFYVSDEIYEMGLVIVDTPDGNKVRTYDIERSICDIIRSKNRMDLEHVKYSIREYIKRKDKDLIKLSKYADKMGIKKEVMDFVEIFYE